MPSVPLQQEPLLRIACFTGVLLAMALWEQRAPRRLPTLTRARRWPGNLGVAALDTLLLRALFPVAAVGVAALGEASGLGLLHHVAAPRWLEFALAVVALD